ncbi:hypothetical protein DAI22_04g233201 [Oryza sativa Japonica Group]|nr:hypothetical protein DAI22_04g233201 [Oryza sativa Japonica Group]
MPCRSWTAVPTAPPHPPPRERGCRHRGSSRGRRRRAGWPTAPPPRRGTHWVNNGEGRRPRGVASLSLSRSLLSLPLSLPSPAAAESSPSRIFAGPPTVRGVDDGSSTTARGAWGGRRRGARRVASLSLSRSLLSLPLSLSPVAGSREVVAVADPRGAADSARGGRRLLHHGEGRAGWPTAPPLRRGARGVADGSSTTARGARGGRRLLHHGEGRAGWPTAPPLRRGARGVADGSSTTARGARGGRRLLHYGEGRAGWTTARGAWGGLSLPLPLASLPPSLSLPSPAAVRSSPSRIFKLLRKRAHDYNSDDSDDEKRLSAEDEEEEEEGASISRPKTTLKYIL